MNDKLAHLTKDEVEILIKRYYNKEKVKDLLAEFSI